MDQYADFERNSHSKSGIGNNKIGYDFSRFWEGFYYADTSFYENINYFDLMASFNLSK